MATVILSAVGTYFGGPIGSAVGAAIGQQIDRAIIGGGKAREGPRIKELDIQTSSYGTQVPAIFGVMRVAGTVIWSTDLIETRTKNGGGKNRPATLNYSYSASFAVALSSRPVARVGRIWADGNLLRGAADDLKSEAIFRFHNGHGDQPPDPLLSSAETTGQCPAHRGMAYAVFEDFQLADFGNRIPSLTFELFERETQVSLIDIARATSAGAITGQSAATLTGFAVQGSDCRSALEPLMAALPVLIRPVDDKMAVSDWYAATPTNALNDAAVSDGRSRIDRPSRAREANNRAPSCLSIRHYEPQRDFQTGVQSSRSIGSARTKTQIDLPAAIDASVVRNFAELQLLQRWRGLNGIKASLPVGATSVLAGNQLAVPTAGSTLRIVEVEHQRGTTRVTAREWIDSVTANPVADPGRSLPGSDLIIGETRLILADLPAFGTDDPGRATVVAAAAGTGAGWKRAALSLVDGARVVELGGTRGAATMGYMMAALPPHTAMLEDQLNQPVIRLLHDNMTLPTGSGEATSFDAPSLWIDGEIVRYGNAEKIGPRDYRLNRLLRGCFGTNTQLGHAAQTDVFLIESGSLLPLDSVPTPMDLVLEIEAQGIADAVPVAQSILTTGNAIRPRSPVHGVIERLENGDILLRWQRRERLAHHWTDGADIPNSEGEAAYVVELYVDGALLITWNIANPLLLVAASEIGALSIAPGASVQFEIVQQGRFARSLSLKLSTNW
jgi:Putative phage tail protein